MVEAHPVLTILPPIIAITLAIITRKVLLSLGLGIIAAGILLANFAPGASIANVWNAFAANFYSEGEINTGSIYIMVFLLLLGVITALILMSGGSAAFSDWAASKIKSRRGAQGLAVLLGIAIFIDDYFNALAVGQIAKPVTDKYKVARAKLAYVIDSTSAPVAVLAPFSSWGASIIGLLAPVVAASAYTGSPMQAFLSAAAANYYAIGAVIFVLLVVFFQIDIGSMRREEYRAIAKGETFSAEDEIPGELSEDLPVHDPGKIRALVIPFIVLVVGVVGTMMITGGLEGGSWSLLDMFANTKVNESLIIGGTLGTIAALACYIAVTRQNPDFHAGVLGRGVAGGAKSMMPAIAILLLAWTLGSLIGELGTGNYLASLVEGANVSVNWLIPLMFLIAGFMAFSTGTSWGSFGLLIPIAGEIMVSLNEPDFLVPAIGAVLAGAVLGDHCSPISDTTILSSTGAGCSHIVHVATQLPYALIGGTAALLGYVTLAITSSAGIGLIVTLLSLLAFALIANKMTTTLEHSA
ncbi:Na+/H+ antiporter NhaC family protein [Corynebacterium gerontici]|uniref:Malate-2H(+)/Na(+)-lactate antiporter n=1 Tax=Corynebacterium gerontici TaxID=2079234 RepID=A0A3G6IYJ9_9CORY|nr:Na+/H+ antiporter NhaC family protein [Corynebacterium gerontici]AZA10563.1 Malate-2H(+)/Na(+)-lactate antiporter [Corynebacterium gerontici]